MLKHPISSILITSVASVILLAGNVRAESVTFELSVVLPPHVMTAAAASNMNQSIQQQAAVRNNIPVLLQSVVVL